MRICIFGSASDDIDSVYIEAGEKLGEMLGKKGHSLIFGAGNSGMMGAVARGFHRAGAEIVGVVPSFFPDGVLFPHCTELVKTETMRERKAIMEERADAFITTVGGIGTFETEYTKLMEKGPRRVSPLFVPMMIGTLPPHGPIAYSCTKVTIPAISIAFCKSVICSAEPLAIPHAPLITRIGVRLPTNIASTC